MGRRFYQSEDLIVLDHGAGRSPHRSGEIVAAGLIQGEQLAGLTAVGTALEPGVGELQLPSGGEAFSRDQATVPEEAPTDGQLSPLYAHSQEPTIYPHSAFPLLAAAMEHLTEYNKIAISRDKRYAPDGGFVLPGWDPARPGG